jgi:SAM-dependent methyltransferase
MHTNSELIFKKYGLGYFVNKPRVLEIGPDKIPSTYYRIVKEAEMSTTVWDTIDLIENAQLTYQSISEYKFPINDEQYDVVISGQVMEHVRKPWKWMAEIRRVTKINGIIVVICPASWPYHEAPVDCWRVYAEGIRALFEDQDLETLKACTESLETTLGVKHYIPGRSMGFWGEMTSLYEILAKNGLPVERSYDTLGIAKRYI